MVVQKAGRSDGRKHRDIPSDGSCTVILQPRYRAQGNFVFNAATIYWPQAQPQAPGHILPRKPRKPLPGYDKRVEIMTRNLVNRAIGTSS